MPIYQVQVNVLPRPILLDPEGETISNAAQRMGYEEVRSVRAGRIFAMEIEASTAHAALQIADRLAQQLLHNPVVEIYEVHLISPQEARTERE